MPSVWSLNSCLYLLFNYIPVQIFEYLQNDSVYIISSSYNFKIFPLFFWDNKGLRWIYIRANRSFPLDKILLIKCKEPTILQQHWDFFRVRLAALQSLAKFAVVETCSHFANFSNSRNRYCISRLFFLQLTNTGRSERYFSIAVPLCPRHFYLQ